MLRDQKSMLLLKVEEKHTSNTLLACEDSEGRNTGPISWACCKGFVKCKRLQNLLSSDYLFSELQGRGILSPNLPIVWQKENRVALSYQIVCLVNYKVEFKIKPSCLQK